MTTLTITLEDDAAAAAERMAERDGTDVASVVRRFILLFAGSEKEFDRSMLPPITRSALGLAKGLPDKPYKELAAEAMDEKYESLK